MLSYIVKYELALSDIKYNPLPEEYKFPLTEKYSAEDMQNMASLISSPIGFNKALIIQRGKETSADKKQYKVFINFRNAKDFVNSYTNANSLKPSMELASHINRLVMKGIVDDWDLAKIRGFSEKPNEIYDTWYKSRDFYPNLDITNHFNQLFDWLQNGKDNNHMLIKIAILVYEFIDKAPFIAGNQITALLIAEILSKKYGYNPDNIFPTFKSMEYISEDILAAFKMTKGKLDLTPFIEAFLYTISLTSIEISNDIKKEYTKKVKKLGDTELALNQRQMQIYDFLTLNQKVTRGQVDKIMDLSFMTSFRELKDMEEKGYIKQKGKGRGAYYVLSKEMLEKEDSMTPKIE